MNDESQTPHPDSAEAHAEKDTAEITYLADLFLRMVGGRSLTIALSSLTSAINTLSKVLPVDGQKYIGTSVTQLGMDILNESDKQPVQTELN